ncbi:MAG: uroporphyrinogen-III synthase [Methanosarcinaceae archaeon]|nr:uroporphyrinogen-III synthase [Methanosarcinaceae archaeon]
MVTDKPVLAIMRPEVYRERSLQVANEIGFCPIMIPVVELEGQIDENFEPFVKRVLENKTDYVIFTSANGIDYSLKNVGDERKEEFLAALKNIKIISIGPTTKEKLEELGLMGSVLPGEYSSKGIVSFLDKSDIKGKIIDIPRSFHGTEVLPTELTKSGAEVHETFVYTLKIPDNPNVEDLIEKAVMGEIDAFAFTSSMMVRNFLEIAENMGEKEAVLDVLNESVVGAIGVPTAETLESYGVTVDAVPDNFTFEELLQTIYEIVRTR